MRSGLSFTDPYSGFVGAGAVLTALHYRRRTGKGQYIDLSEQEAAIPISGRGAARLPDDGPHAGAAWATAAPGPRRRAAIAARATTAGR